MSFELKKYVQVIREKLSNGLDIVILNNPKAPIVSLNLSYKVGSKDEKFGVRGFAHLFEHLMFEGSQNVPKGEFDKYCSASGGTNNAYTTYDYTAYTMTLPSNKIELGLWLESDRMFFSKISQKALETQQKVVIEEILQTVENQPYGKWRENLAMNAYSELSSYSWEVHGNKDDVANSTLENVNDFFEKFYNPQNACLVLSGDCEHDKTLKLVKKYFDIESNSNPISRNIFLEEYKLKGKKAITYDNVPLNAVFISFHCENIFSKELYIADVLTFILGVGKSSELYKSMVLDKQIAAQVGAYVDKREFTSLITFFAIANSPEISSDLLTESIYQEIEKFKKGDFDNNLLDKCKIQLLTQLSNEIQYSSGLADMIGNFTLFWDNPEMIYDILNKYNDVNQDKIIDFANKYLIYDEAIRVDVLSKE